MDFTETVLAELELVTDNPALVEWVKDPLVPETVKL